MQLIKSSGIVMTTSSLLCVLAISLGLSCLPLGNLAAGQAAADGGEIDRLLAAGRYRDAVPPLQQALEQARRGQDMLGEVRALHDLGVAFLGLDRRDQAADHLGRAADLAEQHGMPVLAASAFDNLGTLHARQPAEHPRAAEAYRRAIDLAESEGEAALAFNALTNHARLDIDRNAETAALALLERARRQLDSMEPGAEITDEVLLLGRLLARAGATEAGYGALADARERAKNTGQPRLESLAAGYLGELYADAGRDQDAILLYGQATFLAQAAGAEELIYRWQWQIGRRTAQAGRVDRAIEHYRRAITALDQLRPTLIDAPASVASRVDLRSAYVELADLMLRRAAAHTSAADRQRDLEEARQTIERYRSTELTDYFRDECVTDLLASVKPIDRLAPRTAVLYPIVMADRLVILLSLANGLQQRSVPIGAETLTRDILELRQLLEKRTTHQYLRPAKTLYDLLLRPLEPTLTAAGVDTLVIVPDEALRTVPLAALHDGERFVVDRYALATVPSLRLIEPRPLAKLDIQPLLSGLSEPVQGFPPLPYVETELKTIEGVIGGDILSNRAFVKERIERSLGGTPHTIVHIASHAQFTGDARESFILTYDGRLDMDSLEDFIKLSRFRDRPVELLTLSACETAAGDDRAALGLAGLAVKSGARSALASLWYVNDRASSLLVAGFYRQLHGQPGISKAKALQRAQIETKADLRYRHPAHWAPLVLIGNWL